MNTDIAVPIVFFVVGFLAIRAVLLHRDATQRELHQTLRTAIQSGQAVPDAVLHRLAAAADPRRADLRRAIVFAVMAVVVVAMAWLLPFADEHGRRAFLCIGIVPGAMALTHLALWRFWYRNG